MKQNETDARKVLGDGFEVAQLTPCLVRFQKFLLEALHLWLGLPGYEHLLTDAQKDPLTPYF
jgi:hypothetical protein